MPACRGTNDDRRIMSVSPKTVGVFRGLVVVLLAGMSAGVVYVALTAHSILATPARGALAGALIFGPIFLVDVAAANSEMRAGGFDDGRSPSRSAFGRR